MKLGPHTPPAPTRPAQQVLANDAAGRSQFVHSGGLAAVQQLAEAPGSKLKVRWLLGVLTGRHQPAPHLPACPQHLPCRSRPCLRACHVTAQQPAGAAAPHSNLLPPRGSTPIPTNLHLTLACQEAVEIINSCFPEEIVRYYSPSYSKQLLDKLDAAAGLTAGSTIAVA